MALWFFEAQDFATSEQLLRTALDAHNAALHAYYESLNSSPAEKESNIHGNRSAA